MAPVIRYGERVLLHNRPARCGAVAAFVTRGGELELHRLVARGPGGWWAHLGDNQVNPVPGLVHASQIVGIAEVPYRDPRLIDRGRALVRFSQAAGRLTLRRIQARILG